MPRDARSTLERLVLDKLREDHGAAAIAQRPLSVGSTLTLDEPADFIAAITEARWLAITAVGLAKEYARKARGAGRSWRDLVEPLGVEAEDDWTDLPAEAFKMVAHEPSQRYDRVWTSWTCRSCDQSIIDYGPYNGHPEDDEKGHAEGCQRLAREVAAYRKRNGDDE